MNQHAAPQDNIEHGTRLIDIATRNVTCLAHCDSVREAARIMTEKRISALVITDEDGHPRGIVTERNILHAMQSGCPPESALDKIMSSPVITVTESANCLESYQVFLRNGIRHLVIVDDDKHLLGVVSETDYRLHINLATLAGHRQITSVMNHSVFSVSPQDRLQDALNLMQAHCDSCVVVVDNGYPAGIITERDIVRLYSGNLAKGSIPVGDIMTSPVLTVPLGNTINEAARRMLKAKVRHLAVIDANGQLAGLLSEHELTQAMTCGLIDSKTNAQGAFLHSMESSLAESERRYRMLIENSPFCIHEIDLKGDLQSMNRAGLKMLGLSDEKKICGIPYLSVVSEIDSGRIGALLQDAINGAASDFEFESAGELPLYFKSCFIPIRDADGCVVSLMGLTEDISRRRRLEMALEENISALRRSEEKLRMLIEAIPDPIQLKDGEGRWLESNLAARQIFGLEQVACHGKADEELSALVEPGFRESLLRCARTDEQAWRAGGISHLEEIISLDDGRKLFFDVIKRPLFHEEGKRAGLVVFGRDVTELRQSQEALMESEELFRAIFEQAPNGIELIDPVTLRFVGVNPAACRMLGYTHEEYLHLRLSDTQANQDQETLIESIRQREGMGCITFENRHRCKNGDILDVEVTACPLNLHGKRLLIGIWRDITGQKRSQEEIKFKNTILQTQMEVSLDAILVVDDNAQIITYNQEFIRLWRLSPQIVSERLDAPVLQSVVDQVIDPEIFVARVRHLYGHREEKSREEIRLKDGRIVDRYSAPVTGADGKYYGRIWYFRDITGRRRAEEALQHGKDRIEMLLNSVAEGIYGVDALGRCTFINSAGLDLLGYQHDTELIGKHMHDLIHHTHVDGSHYAADECRLYACLQSHEYVHVDDELFWRKDGSSFPVDYWSRPTALNGEDGAVITFIDITERKRAEENLRIIASVFDNSQEAILITDANNLITDVNPAFTRITGFSREEVLGQAPVLLNSGRQDKAFYDAMWQSLKQEKAWRGEIWNQRKSGEIYAEMLSISVICDDDGKLQRHVGVFSDISYLKEHEDSLNRIAHYDALTGIPNRVLLADRMKQAIAQTSREQNMVAICYLDLDGFKPVNDNLGHEAGDQVLIEIARRLENTVRSGDTVARLGGDEFVVLLLGLEKGEECMATLERLLAAIARPITVKGKQITLGASIGVSIYPLDDEVPDILLRHADQAMYMAKQSGKNRFNIYDAAMDQRTRNRHDLMQSIHYALELGQFELHYQPKINLRTKQLVGAEALIRWRHPERGLLMPAEFLRTIENTDLDIEIGDWVIAAALVRINDWQLAGMDIEVSINISAHHLESADFVEKLRGQLQRYPDLHSGRLQIEVLETVALNDLAVVREIIEACRMLGVGFALDDFGTGYSSLSYLSRLPVDVLKIDQSFVRDMLVDKGDKAIVQGIIALAQAFERQTVAEGIETGAQYHALLDMGCEVGQGFGIARPMPGNELSGWLKNHRLF
jgi:diguanylate cyclase (GGDEF)-like protein/PAS domain S-box-containing protein